MKDPVEIPEYILQNGIANSGSAAEKRQGLPLDTSAQRSSIGVQQAKMSCEEMG